MREQKGDIPKANGNANDKKCNEDLKTIDGQKQKGNAKGVANEAYDTVA